LVGANLCQAELQGAYLRQAQLQGAALVNAQLAGDDLSDAQLQDASLIGAQLQKADLSGAQLQGTKLLETQFQGAKLTRAQLQGAAFMRTDLRGCNLLGARLDVNTELIEPRLDARVQFANVLWNGALLIRPDWEQVPSLGDEEQAREKMTLHMETAKGTLTQKQRPKTSAERLTGYQTAARAYLQLAVALRGQGIIDAADRFTYRALIMQRKAIWWKMRSIPLLAGSAKKTAEAGQAPQRPPSAPLRRAAQQVRDWLAGMLGLGRLIGPYLFSWFLAVLTGYGFRMSRIVVAYLLLICGFATAYWSVGVHQPRDISFWTALIVSVTAFHLSKVHNQIEHEERC
jgi:hypothetical protein